MNLNFFGKMYSLERRKRWDEVYDKLGGSEMSSHFFVTRQSLV